MDDHGIPEYMTKLDRVEQVIRELIASGEIGPGERLRQNDLAERLGTSSTPIREALRRLEAQGIIVSIPHRGVRVAEVDPEEMSELYQIRAVLEGLAVTHSVPNLSPENLGELRSILEKTESTDEGSKDLRKLNYDFHTSLYRRCNLRRLTRLIDSLWALFPWDSVVAIPGRAASSIREHREILEAVERLDGQAAGEAMRHHVESGEKAFVEFRRSRGSDEMIQEDSEASTDG